MFEPKGCTLIIPGPGKGGWVRLVLSGTFALFEAGAAVLEAEPQP